MTPKSVPPSTTKTVFNCPYCGAFSSQSWLEPYVLNSHFNKAPRDESPADALKKVTEPQLDKKLVFMEGLREYRHVNLKARNLFLSSCFTCKEIAVWVHEQLVFPPQRIGQEPNPDLPDDIIRDFEEARSILNYSPRGAAALLRLSIQKLCAFLGEKGKKIDDDIASLVTKGLNPHVQKSLDIVRVIGNEAVHPGVMDIKDDRDTALMLLKLVNIIAEQTISHPKMINEMYEQLPADKKKGIENRDKQAQKNVNP